MTDRNLFGGKNALGVYTPMSDIEQEALDRLKSSGELVVEVVGIGAIPVDQAAEVKIGDHRLSIGFYITFKTPNNRVVTKPYLDLVLRTRSGIILFRDRQAFKDIHGNPMMISTGLTIPMIWDIGINKIDPKAVKAIMPTVRGLTTRRGNERLSADQQAVLRKLRAQEAVARRSTKELVNDAVSKVKKPRVVEKKKIVSF